MVESKSRALMKSNSRALLALPYPQISTIEEAAPAIPSLWNSRYSQIDANFEKIAQTLGDQEGVAVKKTSDTGAAILPAGTDSERPDAENIPGLLVRGNTTSGLPEYFDRTVGQWSGFGIPVLEELPTLNMGSQVVITTPHMRLMVWNASKNKYVRAPWHAAGELKYFLRDIPDGYLEVRSDIVLNTADFPDLAEYLNVEGDTFTLDELRGEFLRSLDSSRGVDLDRAVGSWQGSDNLSHYHTGGGVGDHIHGFGYHNNNNNGSFLYRDGVWQNQLAAGTRGAIWNGSSGGANSGGTTTYNLVTSRPIANTFGSTTGDSSPAQATNNSGGLESRPRNKAYRLAVQY